MDLAKIHPQLLEDCHVLGDLPSGILLLNRNAALHWFIIVPDSELHDVLDLPESQAHVVLADAQAVSKYLKERLSYAKVNVAALGNQVPQMHLHIIGRRIGDACWPDPVWGNLQHSSIYTDDKIAAHQQALIDVAGLSVAQS